MKAEAVPESLKNILLVMSASGVLVEPGEGRDGPASRLWETSWARIGQFCPSLKDEFRGVLAKVPTLPTYMYVNRGVHSFLLLQPGQPNAEELDKTIVPDHQKDASVPTKGT